ncbi:MAG: folylpolyglutamate synthase/dihydrofolate synthase family protein [archaeon]|jgi:dihydrofolate synthase/folylpolyglutamate synthase
MDSKSVFDNLAKLEHVGMKLGLERIVACLTQLHNPQNNFDSIHVAGTNGKGSTCAMIARGLRAEGYKTGLFTSPHLVKFNERIQINGELISDENLLSIYSELSPLFDKYQLTFFEATTVIAFVYFARNKVNKAVIEVGLGGRFDATNVILPKVSVITDIGFDHVQYLGDTISKIAFEKAGIIKNKVPLVVAKDNAGISTIKKVAKEKESKIIYSQPTKLPLGLNGDYQKRNASLASTVLSFLGVSKKSISFGLKNVLWPARMQCVGEEILIDGAHNPSGVKVLCKELKKIKSKKILIVGILADKDYTGMIKLFSKNSDYIIFTVPKSSSRAASSQTLSVALPNLVVPFKITSDIKEALDSAIQVKKSFSKKSTIVICGSLYLAGEALAELKAPLF